MKTLSEFKRFYDFVQKEATEYIYYMIKPNTRIYNHEKKKWEEYVCKIGKSTNIEKRQNDLNFYVPNGSDCCCLFKQIQVNATTKEKECHEYFKKQNITNEYFNIEPEKVKQYLQNEFFPIQEISIDNIEIQKEQDNKQINRVDGICNIAVICQKNIQYKYQNKWQYLVRIFAYNDQKQLDTILNHQSALNRTSCLGKNYFELIQTYKMTISSFIELYNDYYVNNGYYTNFTDIQISPEKCKDVSLQYFKYFEKWFDQNSNPPSRFDKINNFPIGEKWWRIINTQNGYKQLKEKIEEKYNIKSQPAFKKTDLDIEYRLNYTIKWIEKNNRLPLLSDKIIDLEDKYQFSLHSFYFQGLQGKYGEEVQKIFKNIQLTTSNKYTRLQKLQENLEKYIINKLQQDNSIQELSYPEDQEIFKKYNFTKRNWQDMCGNSAAAEKYKEIKENIEQKYNIKLVNKPQGFQKSNDLTIRYLRKICSQNKIKYNGLKKDELIKNLQDQDLI